MDEAKAVDDPVVLIEGLSPSTSSFDQGAKLEEYRRLPSLDRVVLVDPVNRLTCTSQRQSSTGWLDSSFAQPHDVSLPPLSITLTEQEIFAAN